MFDRTAPVDVGYDGVMTEEWRDIPGYEGMYQVSDDGRVRSVDRIVTRRDGISLSVKGRPIKTHVNSQTGYVSVDLSSAGGRTKRTVHDLVITTFVGPVPDGQEVRHLNGMRRDNHLANLAFGDRSRNMLDAIEHGTHPQAGKTHCPQDHPYSGDNLVTLARPNGRVWRYCRACQRDRDKRRCRR